MINSTRQANSNTSLTAQQAHHIVHHFAATSGSNIQVNTLHKALSTRVSDTLTTCQIYSVGHYWQSSLNADFAESSYDLTETRQNPGWLAMADWKYPSPARWTSWNYMGHLTMSLQCIHAQCRSHINTPRIHVLKYLQASFTQKTNTINMHNRNKISSLVARVAIVSSSPRLFYLLRDRIWLVHEAHKNDV
jgi:hypothetical protein